MKRARGVAVALALAPLVARAEVRAASVWERAADPEIARADRVHREVEVLLLAAQRLHFYSPAGQELLGRAMQRLSDAKADRSPDVRLRFDFGYVAELQHDERRAVAALESALGEAPHHPLAARAYFSLGVCFAKLGRPAEEIASYDEYLAREPDPGARSLALSNRAEAEMLMGRLTRAVADYRAALALEPSSGPAHLGLAVALDRSGDAPGGLAEAKVAVRYDPLDRLLTSPDVFFIPEYDRYWYEAMGATARAEQVDDPATAILVWETAVAAWSSYTGAAAADDRWLALAGVHGESASRRLTDARRKAARASKSDRATRAGAER